MSRRWENESPQGRWFARFNAVFLWILIATMIIPLLNTLTVSLSSNIASMQPGIKLWPKEINFEGYKTVWNGIELWQPFVNNVIVTVIGTLFHVFLAALAGYVLLQRELPGKKWMTTFIILTMIIPAEAIMIPLYVVNQELGLLNTLTSLVVSGLVSGFSILLMRNFFLSVPYELAEAARIDGASEFRIFTDLYLRLAKPGVATVTLFEFVHRWNQFTSALLYINDDSKYTLQLALRSLIIASDSTSSSDFITANVRMAGIMIALIPLIIIYPFVQKYFVKGIMLGSTKE
ncbi:carbohydrate ABC transporter permease [Effusibacillus lacus]|uniref:ABC transporter permease n=1 Tax=Effusibacillus lacus TaxID=1348429 RepID=A0A292YJE7_9BACL|nr:carbohydrate ABC transporter permease [Effusibacillus lacus]TCS69532.1 carbohydrate ABC transporter membrane protein 2 (CUT1 family) [Effusibacillus lacus]GAX90058.1 ABC transporter permease [Effusibacillus lacus]